MPPLTRYLQTLRHLSYKQMLYRGYYIGRRRWWRLVGKQAVFAGEGLKGNRGRTKLTD